MLSRGYRKLRQEYRAIVQEVVRATENLALLIGQGIGTTIVYC